MSPRIPSHYRDAAISGIADIAEIIDMAGCLTHERTRT